MKKISARTLDGMTDDMIDMTYTLMTEYDIPHDIRPVGECDVDSPDLSSEEKINLGVVEVVIGNSVMATDWIISRNTPGIPEAYNVIMDTQAELDELVSLMIKDLRELLASQGQTPEETFFDDIDFQWSTKLVEILL